jgi:copper transport protein
LSVPAAGVVLPAGPSQISLVFSEPIEARYTALDLLDGTGATLLAGAGGPSPTNPDVLVVDLAAPLPAGSYTVDWRASSAADGHDTTGFFVFGVGSLDATGLTHSASSNGRLHPGQDTAHAAAEIQGKTAAYGGAMVAFGLAVLAGLVLLPGLGRVPRGTAYGAAIGLLVAGGGSLILIVVGATSFSATATAGDYLTYATGSRAGVLLTARLVLGLAAGLFAIVLARRGRTGESIVVCGLAASAEIGLIAAVSHAAAFSSPLPIAVDIVHVGAASIWLAGLVALGGLTDFGGRTRLAPELLRDLVRRFSAIALVSIALIATTGVYAAWIEIGDFTAIRSAYDLDLAIKVAVFVLAIAVGALNYLDGGRDRPWLGGLSKRLLLELCLAVAVVVIAANLTSGSPTGTDRPVAISPSGAGSSGQVGFAIQPGRPGPNRYVVTLPSAPGLAINLDLARLDGGTGSLTIPLVTDPADPTGRTEDANVAEVSAESTWQATVATSAANGTEIARATFDFAFDDQGLSAGRSTPSIDPLVIVALVLLLGSLLGAGLSLAGRSLPRTLPATSRLAVIGGSIVGAVLGVAILVGGTPR